MIVDGPPCSGISTTLKQIGNIRSGWEVLTNDLVDFHEELNHSDDFFEMLRQECESRAGLHWFYEEFFQRLRRETVAYASGKVIVVERSLDSLSSLASVLVAINRLSSRAEKKIKQLELETAVKTIVPCWQVAYVHVDVNITENLRRLLQRAKVHCRAGAMELLLKYDSLVRRQISCDGILDGNASAENMTDDLVTIIDYILEQKI